MEFTAERFKIADKINYVMEVVGNAKSAEFTSLFPLAAMRGEIIVTFLAILELAKMLLIKIHQTEDGIIRVYLPAVAEKSGNEPGIQENSNN